MVSKYFTRLLNFYARYIGFALMFLLPVAIFVALGYYTFNILELQQISANDIIFLLWTMFVINSGILSLNGIVATISFSAEVRKLLRRGTPIHSAEGFRNLERRYKISHLYLLVITLLALIAYGLFMFSVWQGNNFAELLQIPDKAEQLSNFIFYLSLSGMLFTIAASILIRIPPVTGISSGSLLPYYTPTRHPYVLNFYFYDAIYALLDPITRIEFLNWSDKIEKNMLDDFAPKIAPLRRRQLLATQNVLILLYLHFRMSEIIDKEYLLQELRRIVPGEIIESEIIHGKLNINVWKKNFKHFIKTNPDIFLIVDRIFLTLKENAEVIDQNKFWITSAVPPVQKLDSTQSIIFFVLNRNREYVVPKILTLYLAGSDAISPSELEFVFRIRGYDDFVTIPKDTSRLTTQERRNLVRLITGILYQGTGIWLSLKADNIGYNACTIDIREENDLVTTQALEIRVVRDLKYYLQNWGPKILASLGVILPILRTIIGL